MSIPASLTPITVTCTYPRVNGVVAAGTVEFLLSAPAGVPVDGAIVPQVPAVATLDDTGSISIVLPATNDPDWAVTGLTYQVTERITGTIPRVYNIAVPAASAGGTLNLAAVAPAVAGPPLVSYVLAATVGAPSGVASLDGTGNVPLSQLGHAPSGGEVSSVNGHVGDVVLTAADVSAVPAASAGTPNGVATLDATGNVPLSQLGHAPGGGGGGLPTPALYNVETYGAVGDGTTDDGPAILAAWNAGVATGLDFYLVFPRSVEYLVNVDALLTPSGTGEGQYAVFKFPMRQTNVATHKQMLGVIGPGQACSTRVFPGDGNITNPVTNTAVIKVAYTTPPTYHATHGWPSLFGAPDRDKNGACSNVHVHWKGVTVRQPPNPAMACLNIEGAATCHIEDFFADVTGPPDSTPEPTRPTGAAILWPRNANAATVVGGRVGAWGYFGGIPFAEHLVLDFAYALRCKIAHPIREGLGHACTITWTTTEECVYTIAGYDGSSPVGVVAIPSGGNDPTIKMGLSIEDFGFGADPWYYAPDNGTNIYDPNNVLRGIIWFERSEAAPAGSGPATQLLAKGATNVTTISLRTGATAAKIQQWVDPVAPGSTVPDAPTIGTATAGNTTASVAFTPPGSDGGSAITGYTATSTPGGLTGTATTSPITVAGLTNGVSYTLTVHATNTVGNSAESAASNSVTPSGGLVTYAADTFTRADSTSTLGTSSGGQAWTALVGTYGISANKGYCAADGAGSYNVAAIDAGQSTVTYTITLTPPNGSIDLGPCALVQDADNLVFWDISGAVNPTASTMTTRLFKRSAGAFTGITSAASMTLTASTPTVLKMVVGPTVISCYQDGVLIFASSGATGLEANTRYGLMQSTASTDRLSRWSALTITN